MHTIKWLFFSLMCLSFTCKIDASSSPVTVINEIPPSGLVIESPGTYVFGKDIIWTPSGDGLQFYPTMSFLI
jgi:hypothetical protein